MSSKTNSKKRQAGLIRCKDGIIKGSQRIAWNDPFESLKKQRRALQNIMDDLVIKCYKPSIIDVSGQAIYYKWSSEKAEGAFKKAQALFIIISRKIKEQDELQ